MELEERHKQLYNELPFQIDGIYLSERQGGFDGTKLITHLSLSENVKQSQYDLEFGELFREYQEASQSLTAALQ